VENRSGNAAQAASARRKAKLAAFPANACDRPRCHELRIPDEDTTWRIIYRLDSDAVIVAEVFAKKTSATLRHVIDVCKERLRQYDKATKEQDT
jgi:phage-related protein